MNVRVKETGLVPFLYLMLDSTNQTNCALHSLLSFVKVKVMSLLGELQNP